jgi:hypothetical protein
MNVLKSILVCFLLPATFEARAQVPNIIPQVRVKDATDGKVTVVEVAAHFVTAIKLPEPVNSVAIGDPAYKNPLSVNLAREANGRGLVHSRNCDSVTTSSDGAWAPRFRNHRTRTCGYSDESRSAVRLDEN